MAATGPIGTRRVNPRRPSWHIDMQRQALTAAGCEVIFEDKASGALNGRKGLRRVIERCTEGGLLVVWIIDRLGRSLLDLVGLVEELKGRGIGLKVLIGHGTSIDTTKPDGRMMFGILATLAEFERELIRERTRAGMAAARRRGVHVGRPRKLTTQLD